VKTLLTNGTIHPYAASAMAYDDGVITWIGNDPPLDADEIVDLDGKVVTPAFVDSHVHSGMTGFQLLGIDLSGKETLTACLDAVADHAARHDGVVIGYGWDETAWPERRVPTGDDLERAAPGRLVYIARVDGHSAIVSPALASRVDGLAGLAGSTGNGRVERIAHHAVRDAVASLTPATQRRAAIEAALRSAASYGIGAVHELGAPHICPADDMLVVKEVGAAIGMHVTTYWGELGAFSKARELGVAGLAGDLVADGAVGSRTAALTEP
jgi:predicted amidohydrolase YtcJ